MLGVCDSPNRSKLRPLGPPAAQERLAQQGVWTLPTRTRQREWGRGSGGRDRVRGAWVQSSST